MDMNVAHTVSGLIQTGKRTEASELTLRWMHAFQKWHEDVSNAPENGPDIHISD
jgi:sensor histidine kinase regulating citrate/malate metabolism